MECPHCTKNLGLNREKLARGMYNYRNHNEIDADNEWSEETYDIKSIYYNQADALIAHEGEIIEVRNG